MSKGPVIAVVGPSGVGKDSIMRGLAARDPGLRMLRRVITRDSDAGEDIVAVDLPGFARMQAEGAFALSWQAHGLHYGIPVGIDGLRNGARGVLVNLSRGVLTAAQARFGDMRVLSLHADPQVLAARLAARGREDATDQARRLQRAERSLPGGLRHVTEIDNSGSLDDTVGAILAQLQSESA